ncbi:tetratricopeptide repeat protein [Virgibacillus sp. NKC19-3]|uniref:tetratricopeptide repeat protein n=1 Tax=Virgibacillus saliphilus TaxID=2831674 RepID=UPI001C9B11DE|nr:tetratricopeptide repeat protein [Virgibacillus sp. NKC19-3]MBY7144195.1 tetratricopeptide repeat protein [Virgibacillus sp. NKC19-3]
MKNIKNQLHRAFEFVNNGYLKQAEILYLECLDEIDDQQSHFYKQAIHGLGLVKSELNQFKEAYQLYTEVLHITRNDKDVQGEAVAYHQLGMVERSSENFKKALYFFAKEYEIYDTMFPKFHLGFAANLYERGKTYLLQNKLKEAKNMMEVSLNHGDQTEDVIVVGYARRDLGYIFQQLGEKQKAMTHYTYALDAFQKADDSQTINDIEKKIANL